MLTNNSTVVMTINKLAVGKSNATNLELGMVRTTHVEGQNAEWFKTLLGVLGVLRPLLSFNSSTCSSDIT